MKKIVNHQELEHLSFPDSRIINEMIDKKNRNICFIIDRAFLDIGSGYEFNEGKLVIYDWIEFISKVYNFNTEEWVNSEDLLYDILEFSIDDNNIKLAGFSKKSGLWLEYNFINAKIYYEQL